MIITVNKQPTVELWFVLCVVLFFVCGLNGINFVCIQLFHILPLFGSSADRNMTTDTTKKSYQLKG